MEVRHHMDLDYVKNLRFEPCDQTYVSRDSILYALSLGMGSDPLNEDELPFVYEGRGLKIVPSQCVTLGWQPMWHRDPCAGIDWVSIVHGELAFTLHRPLTIQGTVRTFHVLKSVEDKGPGRGALLHFEHLVTDKELDTPLATIRSVQFLRGDGGCGNWGIPVLGSSPLAITVDPSWQIDYSTSPQGALMYRQASHDLMPIHADPHIARMAGFHRPISHGLHTMGLACRAIIKRYAPSQPERLLEMSVRFVQPVFPGETVRIELFEYGELVRFRARSVERDVLLLDRGSARLDTV